MNTPALLPCPFCGSTNNNSAEPNEWGVFYVECQDCGTRGPANDYECLEGSDIGRAKAITAWNQRSAGSSCPELKNLVAAITPSEPHALIEGQRITVDGIRGPHADLNGAYAVDSVNPGTITP